MEYCFVTYSNRFMDIKVTLNVESLNLFLCTNDKKTNPFLQSWTFYLILSFRNIIKKYSWIYFPFYFILLSAY